MPKELKDNPDDLHFPGIRSETSVKPVKRSARPDATVRTCLKVRRVTGALAEPRADYLTARAATALERLRQLYSPRRLDATPPNE